MLRRPQPTVDIPAQEVGIFGEQVWGVSMSVVIVTASQQRRSPSHERECSNERLRGVGGTHGSLWAAPEGASRRLSVPADPQAAPRALSGTARTFVSLEDRPDSPDTQEVKDHETIPEEDSPAAGIAAVERSGGGL